MELKYKEQKIRDLFVYHTSIYPKSIDVGRHKVVISVAKTDADRINLSTQQVEQFFSDILGRRTCIDVLKNGTSPSDNL